MVNPYALCDVIKDKGKWNMNKVQNPNGIQLGISLSNVMHCDNFSKDLLDSVEDMKKDPSLNSIGGAAMYGV